MSKYSEYQSMYYQSLFGPPKQPGKKEYALYENGVAGPPGPYPLLQHQRQEKIKSGTPAYLLKIKPIKK